VRRFHGPHAFFEPIDQRQIISSAAKERLTKMNVRLHKTGNDGAPFGVDHDVSTLRSITKLGDAGSGNEEVATNDPVRRIHRDERAVFNEDRRHRPQRERSASINHPRRALNCLWANFTSCPWPKRLWRSKVRALREPGFPTSLSLPFRFA
jgi:hypothetical protein